ncbi:MAG: GAF domain-containing protein [Chloroflexi bacterium]|nr:GAF domain-containing protein [Chloroflexota bacterium]
MTTGFLPQLDNKRLVRMVEISRILNSETHLDQLLSQIIKEAADLTQSEAASIFLLDPRTRQLRFTASSNPIPTEMASMPLSLDNSIAGAIVKANRPMYIQDVAEDPRWNQNIDQAIEFQTKSILGVPMRNTNKKPVGVLEAINKQGAPHFTREDFETLVVLADIAGVAVEKARLIEELEQANTELNELDEIKMNFIAIASHELRTPLSVILGYVSFLRDEASPEMAAQMDSVLSAAVHLRTLIQDMLNLRYVDAGEATVDLEQIDFVKFVKDIRADADETAVAKQQTITVTLPDTPLLIQVDPGMIEVVLGNLLDNSVKFTPQGGRINIQVRRQGSEVWFHIQDTGGGIPVGQLDRIFKRFYQVESPLRRSHEGIGLGLSIAKELVELNNGRIWAESVEGIGSEFYVALQLADA